MNRLAIASVTAAAALGIAGGVGYALASGDDTGGSDVQVRDTTSVDASGPAGDGPLYFLHGTIHDGDTEVETDGVDADLVVAVEHDGDGYVLVSSGDTDALEAVHVADDGTTRPTGVPGEEEREAATDGESGPAAWAPRSPSGDLLLTGMLVDDGPPPSELVVRDAGTGEVVHRFDPGGYRLAAAWGADDATVYVATGSDGTAKVALRRCKVATGTCTTLLEAEGNLVLGSAS
jgi:hypothetical protein